MKYFSILLCIFSLSVIADETPVLPDSSYYPVKSSIWRYSYSGSERPNLEIIFENFEQLEYDENQRNPYVCSMYPAGLFPDDQSNWTADYHARGYVEVNTSHRSNSCFINGGMFVVDSYYIMTIKNYDGLTVVAETSPFTFILRSDHSVEINPAKVIYPVVEELER